LTFAYEDFDPSFSQGLPRGSRGATREFFRVALFFAALKRGEIPPFSRRLAFSRARARLFLRKRLVLA
jgi:hypothetical protein